MSKVGDAIQRNGFEPRDAGLRPGSAGLENLGPGAMKVANGAVKMHDGAMSFDSGTMGHCANAFKASAKGKPGVEDVGDTPGGPMGPPPLGNFLSGKLSGAANRLASGGMMSLRAPS